MATTRGLSVDGLREVHKGLVQLGIPDDQIKTAMNDAGQLIAREAFRLAPLRTGKMARTIKVSKAKNQLTVSVGNNTTVKYAYTFHAVALGKSKGGFTYYYPPSRGRKGYVRKAKVPNNPFLFKAYERKAADVRHAYEDAIDALIKKATP